MTIKDNCDKWIQLAWNEWMQWVRSKMGSHLRVSTRNLIDRMQAASMAPARSEEAWNLLERLKRLSDSFNKLEDVSKTDNYKYERPEAYLECALTAYRMGDLQEALRLFQIPVSEFPARSLYRSISYWIYGCIQWQLPSHLEDAVISWERSLYVMQEAQSDNRNNLTVKGWCTDVIEIMRQAIDEATQLNSPPLKFQNSKAKRSRAEIKQYKAVIRAFPVIGVIPAGTPVELNVKKGDWSISDTVQILNNQYECYSLRGKNEIAIQSGRDYFALKVTGNSMNLSTPVNINDGDYVLMRKQDDAENGEIVAVEIIGEDREATLKKYLIQNNEYVLLPQSDDPNFQEKVLLKKDFHIRGIALAVLKPGE